MKSPAFLFYSSDFLTGCSDMTMEERGQYITLLCLQHQKGHLPKKSIDVVVPKISEDVLRKFNKDDEGLFFNKRLDLETEKRNKISDFHREKANKRWKKTDAGAYAYADAIKENENENRNKKIEDKSIKVLFETFWNLYDKKVDRKKCEPKWLRLSDNERDLCIKNLPAYIQSTPDKKFRRDPETYLNNKSWENEIINPFPVKTESILSYDEIVKASEKDPDIWNRYNAVKKDGERKAVFYPINLK